jgi:hypothetical protein
MLRDTELLHALKTSSTIKDISILFASQFLFDPEDATNCSIPLEGFKNLTSLELYNFFGDPDSLIPDLVDALGECPGLKTLGLSWACDYDCETSPEALLFGNEVYFLKELCEKYGSRSWLSPLPLDTLRLGKGMYIDHPKISVGKIQGKYLPELVQMETLKNLHLFNGLTRVDIGDDAEPLEVGWSQLEDCKSLQTLSVSMFQADVLDWLHMNGNSVQHFIVTEHYSMYDEDLDSYNLLCLPQLSMIFLREMVVPEQEKKRAWYMGGSSDMEILEAESESVAGITARAESWPESPTIPISRSPSAAERASELESRTRARISFEKLDRSTITVLDRLSDHGAQLTRLGLCMDLETQWVSDFKTG